MKLNKPFLLLNMALLISMLLCCCCRTKNVVSSNLIQKRKYNSGYFVDLFSKKHKTLKAGGNELSLRSTQPRINNEPVTVAKNKRETEFQNPANDSIQSSSTIIKKKCKDNQISKSFLNANSNLLQCRNDRKVGEISDIGRWKHFNSSSTNDTIVKRKINGFALAGFISSILPPFFFIILNQIRYAAFPITTIFFYGTFIMVILALVFSIIGNLQINNNPIKWKGNGFAEIGITFGIIEILLLSLLIYFIVISSI